MSNSDRLTLEELTLEELTLEELALMSGATPTISSLWPTGLIPPPGFYAHRAYRTP
jgi:hypothetical protein